MSAKPAWSIPAIVFGAVAVAAGISAMLCLGNSDARPGFHSRTWVDGNGVGQRYLIFVPYVPPPADGYPVGLFLNGFGENNNDGFRQARANFGPAIWEKRAEFPFLIVFVQCNQGQSWTNPDGAEAGKAFAILDGVLDDFPTNRDRIFVTGPSSGGSGVWHLAGVQPNRFAAIVPLCAVGDTYDFVDPIIRSGISVWSLWCYKDDQNVIDYNRSLIRRLRESGGSPLYTATPTPSFKHDCWNYSYRLPCLYDWLLEQRRDASQCWSSTFQPLMNRIDWIGWDEAPTKHWGIVGSHDEPSIQFQGNGNTISWLNSPFEVTEAEFDFEIKSNGVTGIKIRLSGGPKSQQAVIDICPAKLGDGGVYLNEDEVPVASLEPVGQASFRPDDWNDVRVFVDLNRVAVRLNGWKVIDVPRDASWPSSFRISLAAYGPEAIEADWREIRYRTENPRAQLK